MPSSVGSPVDEGSGPPILLLHATLHDRSDFGPVHDALAQGRRVLAVFPLSVRAYMRAKSPADKEVVDRVMARVRTPDGARTAAVLWKSFTEPGHDLRTRAAQITAPVLITWGARDLTAPQRCGKAVQAAIPGSRFEALPTGHVVFSSEPKAWLESVLPFVDAAHGVRHGVEHHT
jgi:pimeloyl-ACP methyl ester carboxylesterase